MSIVPISNQSNFKSFRVIRTENTPPQVRKHRLRSSAYEHEIRTSDKIQAAVGSSICTLVPLILMMKKQKVKNPFELNYGLREMVTLSASSISGGVVAGMISDTKEARKNKFKEGVFQFMNGTIPTWIVSGVLKLAELSDKFNNIPSKIGSVILALAVGMYGTATVSNLLFDPMDKKPDRKLKLKDCMANVDDAIGVLILAKIPFVEKLHIDALLPVIYGYSGYRAGKSN